MAPPDYLRCATKKNSSPFFNCTLFFLAFRYNLEIYVIQPREYVWVLEGSLEFVCDLQQELELLARKKEAVRIGEESEIMRRV
jgi:hypothetical protein